MRIPAAKLREIAVKARCDPDTVIRVWKGYPTKGDSAARARVALLEAGLHPPPLLQSPVLKEER